MTIKAHFDGKVFVPDEPVDLPADREVVLRVESGSGNGTAAAAALRLAENAPCRDRPDIGQSAEWARQLRRRIERREV
jgi:hypothetical protein